MWRVRRSIPTALGSASGGFRRAFVASLRVREEISDPRRVFAPTSLCRVYWRGLLENAHVRETGTAGSLSVRARLGAREINRDVVVALGDLKPIVTRFFCRPIIIGIRSCTAAAFVRRPAVEKSTDKGGKK